MKHAILFLIVVLSLAAEARPGSDEIKLSLVNTSNLQRQETVKIDLEALQTKYPEAVFKNIIVKEKENISSEIFWDPILEKSFLLIDTEFSPGENKNITLTLDGMSDIKTDKLTAAYLGQKTNYIKNDGYYTEGQFIGVNRTVVPADHFPHNALYQFEGPGWESELVGYRLYLDERNRTDIFGKKMNGLFLDQIGKNDLVSDGKESYQSLQEWGMDIFKVGSSLGIGSVATFRNDSVITISNSDSIICEVINGNLYSGVSTTHYNWNVPDESYNVKILYSIAAKSRLTNVTIGVNKEIENICTGLAKHKDTEFITSGKKEGWSYIAVWGTQTLVNDNLGIALFYNKSQLVEITEDELNYIVILNPAEKNISYYFAAAWEQEKEGIKNKKDFMNYLDSEVEKLNNPIEVKIR